MALDTVRALPGGQSQPRVLPDRTTNTSAPVRFEWQSVLGTRTIASTAWDIVPSGPTLTAAANEDSDQTAVADLSSLSSDTRYVLSCTITDSSGDVREARVGLYCELDL